MLTLDEITRGIATVAQEYPIKKADLFGSYANGTSHPGSDVDLLLEFSMPSVSLLTLNAVKYRLEEIFHTEVDVVHGPLSPDSMLQIDRRIPLYGT